MTGKPIDTVLARYLSDTGAIITDSHIVYTSGRHGKVYVNKDALYPHLEAVSFVCEQISFAFVNSAIEVVIAPAIGGIVLTQWVSFYLQQHGNYGKVLAVYAEKDGDGFVIKRGYDKLVHNRRVLVLEDVLTTGGSVRKVIEAVRMHGGFVAGLGALCNRGGITPADVGDPQKMFCLMDIQLDSWPEEECPMCAQGVPICTSVGKGKEFLTRKGLTQ